METPPKKPAKPRKKANKPIVEKKRIVKPAAKKSRIADQLEKLFSTP